MTDKNAGTGNKTSVKEATRFSLCLNNSRTGLCLLLLGNVLGALIAEDQSKEVMEYLNLLHILGKEVPHFLPDRAHISLFFPPITNVAVDFLAALTVPKQI